MDYTPLSELHIGQRGNKIRTRLARIWDSTNPNLGDKLICVDFMLVDEEGTSIQGSMRKEDAPRMRELLTEGKVYTFANFLVASAKNSFRVCNNLNLIRIGTWTIIKEDLDTGSAIPLNTFDLVDKEMMESRLYKDILLTDIIGHLIDIGKFTKFYTNGREAWKKEVHIHTLNMEKIKITLFGAIGENFKGKVSTENDEPVVAIFTSLTVRAYQAETTLASTSATKIYLDLDIKEVTSFRSRILFPKGVNLLSGTEELTGILQEQPLPENKTISQMLEQDVFLYGDTKSMCVAEIADIDVSQGWWYNACAKCKSGFGGNIEPFECRRCGLIGNLPMPWYKLKLNVSDETGKTTFLVFGKHVERLIKIPASTLCNLPGSDRYIVPSVMNDLIGKKFNFSVAAGDKDGEPENRTFKVSQLHPLKTIAESESDTAKEKQKEDLSNSKGKQLVDFKKSAITTEGKLCIVKDKTEIVDLIEDDDTLADLIGNIKRKSAATNAKRKGKKQLETKKSKKTVHKG